MASPQRENGYTGIANELLDAIIKARLAGNPLTLLLLVARESFGWSRKETMPMGYKTMSKKTGIPRSSIQLALAVLIEAKILTVRQGRWKLNKDYQSWSLDGASPLAPGGQPTGQKGASPLAPGGQPTGDSKAIQKERKKNTGRSPVQEVVEVFKFLKKIGYLEVETGVQDPATLVKETAFERIEQVHYAWDKANYRIYLRSAKKLLDAFDGDLADAKVYMTARADEWNEKGLDSWELHGMARDAHNFVAKEITKDAEADGGRALALREGVGRGAAGALGAAGDGRPDRGEGSRRRFTPARELAGRALEGLQPKDD